jgi:hypothetical protein
MARFPERPVNMLIILLEIDKIPDNRTRLLLILAQVMPILQKEEQQVSVVRTECNERGNHGFGSALACCNADRWGRSRYR